MKLSQAILIGDSLKKPEAFSFLCQEWDGYCGCALGGALLAVGVTYKEYAMDFIGAKDFSDMAIAKALWPWLTPNIVSSISHNYCLVAKGEMTIEQLCDYVRSIEPAEPEYEPEEEYWTDADTTREMVNSIKGR